MKEKSPDYYDSDKIENSYKQTSNFVSPKAMIDMKKQPKRDMTKIYRH